MSDQTKVTLTSLAVMLLPYGFGQLALVLLLSAKIYVGIEPILKLLDCEPLTKISSLTPNIICRRTHH